MRTDSLAQLWVICLLVLFLANREIITLPEPPSVFAPSVAQPPPSSPLLLLLLHLYCNADLGIVWGMGAGAGGMGDRASVKHDLAALLCLSGRSSVGWRANKREIKKELRGEDPRAVDMTHTSDINTLASS